MTTIRKKAAATMLTLALAAATLEARDNGREQPPAVPSILNPPADQRAFLIAHAIGTQNYMCLPSLTAPSGMAWTPVGPQATLFNEAANQLLTHFLSPNPDEGGVARATWQHSRDTSAAWAVMAQTSSDAAYVAPGAIPWLLLRVVGAAEGTDGRGRIDATKWIQRVNTAGGVAPSAPCVEIGARSFVPYEADYVFYKKRGGATDND